MNVLFIQWQHIQQMPNGASVYEHNMAKWCKALGHHVKMCGLYKEYANIETIDYFPWKYSKECKRWADLIIARVGDARHEEKPCIWIQHNCQKEPFKVEHGRVIYCAYHVSEMAYKCMGSAVKWPWNRYLGETPLPANPDGKITLVNCNANKGGRVLVELSEKLPEYNFLGITGGYGVQIKGNAPNIEYRPGSLEIKELLKDTSILIMPSETEGLPTIAIEAMSLGIPVLMNAIPAAAELECEAIGIDFFPDMLRKMSDDYLFYRNRALDLSLHHGQMHIRQLIYLSQFCFG